MSGVQNLNPPPVTETVSTGLGVEVTWVDANHHWSICMIRHYRGEAGQRIDHDVFTYNVGPDEAPTAYQALMACLSAYRRRH